MAQTQQPSGSRKCAGWGVELPPNVPAELCPKCLLKLGLGTQPLAGPAGTIVLPPPEGQSRGLPQPGEQLGHYAIIRLLGAGGMGAAFEAEDLESGRRVALKVLSHTLDSPEARERFFREGRLAASINHPNSVYVFGTEEIGGTPVIAMELVPGGTLQDLVRERGPLPIREAVDCVLQIVAGLEAAQRIGILHRDIKPSNCFRDADGAVKIGDFGLSISTTVRVEPALTASGVFLGTPSFCSPEQLRGDELNARSDMYSVGATLFYLLTGRTPFEGKNMVQLLATVLEQRAPSPRKFRPVVPKGLARTVLRCLEKQPAERFKSYTELTQALTPYCSTAPTPATLGLRFLAGLLDVWMLSAINMLIVLPIFGSPLKFLNASYAQPWLARGWMGAGLLCGLLYYALSEGLRGATPGKAICRLRVAGPDDNLPGFGRAWLRALVYVMALGAPYWLIYGANSKAYLSASMATQYLMSLSSLAILGLLFSTMRRRNGFAAVHDLLTRTRVIARVALPSRPVLEARATAPTAVETATAIGPFHVLETLEKSADLEWLLAYDLRLLRKVWVRKVPAGTPPVPPPMRNLGRPGRLRWLAGRRSPEENWDAFEAPAGKPLLSLIHQPQPWSGVRFWLYDLAGEITAAEKDGTLSQVLALDRVWITGDGQAKLLDFPAPGLGAPASLPARSLGDTHAGRDAGAPSPVPPGSTQDFLSQVAAAALEGRATEGRGQRAEDRMSQGLLMPAVPLPVHARKFLQSLPQLFSAQAIATALKPLLQRAAAVSRLRRSAVVAGCVAFPIMACFGAVMAKGVLRQLDQTSPGLFSLSQLLQVRAHMDRSPGNKRHWPDDRQVEIYIAHHYRATITNENSWSAPMSFALIKGEARKFAERSVAEHPALSEEEIEEADAAVDKLVMKTNPFSSDPPPWLPWLVFGVSLGLYVGVPGLIAALLFRGGLVLLIAGVTFVRKDGRRALRMQLFWRAIVTWSPLAVAVVAFVLLYSRSGTLGAGLASVVVLAGPALVSLALPKRGLADRLAGTWPVPR